jgi:hypothetical protein
VAHTTTLLTFGDSLRALADEVDKVPSLIMATKHPDTPATVMIGVKTAAAVEGLALTLGVETTAEEFNGAIHTRFDLVRGRVNLQVYNIAPKVRELHRDPESVPAHDLLEP